MENTIQLPVAELKTALTGLNKVLPKSSALPVLQHLRISRDKSGAVSLQATDLDSYASYQCELEQPGTACQFLVPAETLTRTVKGCSGKDTVTLVQENGVTKLRTFIGSNPVDQRLECLDPKEWPPMPVIESPVSRVNGEFHQVLKQAFECASEEGSRQVLQGACLDTSDPQAHYLVASDGRVMFAANSFRFDLPAPVIIPNRRFLNWSALEKEEAELSAVNAKNQDEVGWVQLKNSRWTFITRQVQGPFPNWRQVIPAEYHTTVLLPMDVVETVLGIIGRVPGDDRPSQPVILAMQQGRFAVESMYRQGEEITRIPIEGASVQGRDMKVALDRRNVAKALRFGLNELQVKDDLSPVLFRNATTRLVIAPVRLDPAPVTKTEEVSYGPNQPVSAGESTPAESPTPTPPQPEAEATTERKPTMSKTPETAEPRVESPVRVVLEQVDAIKGALGEVIRQLASVTGMLRQIEKEKKATDKEIEAVRSKLREIQAVKI